MVYLMGYDIIKAHSGKSCILSPEKFTKYLSYEYFSAMGPRFFLPYHLSYLSSCKSRWTMLVHLYAFKYVFWGPQPSWSLCHFFLGVNRSGPGTSSTTNQRSYIALRWLLGPYCKPVLSECTRMSMWHEVILMVKLLIVSVTNDTPHNRVNTSICMWH